jgi:predicted Rossmann fold nucleotide-binding protein DprA/Smf involved in DNA uptake
MVTISDAEKQALRKALLVDRRTKVQELAERARKVLEIDDQGTAYLRVPREKLSDAQVVGVQLTARKLANLIELVPNDSMTAEELTTATGIPYKPLTARLSELRRKGWIESPERGKYRVVFGAIDELLAEVGRHQ